MTLILLVIKKGNNLLYMKFPKKKFRGSIAIKALPPIIMIKIISLRTHKTRLKNSYTVQKLH